MKQISTKLFAIAKDEAAYIPHWVFHHFYFEFDEIEIWLNNIEDNSIAVCEKLAVQFKNFKFKIADELFHHCTSQNISFQRQAYTQIFEAEKAKNIHTHVMFLDLDEYWVSKDFLTSIKDFIHQANGFDTLSFAWYFDDNNLSSQPFSPVFSKKSNIFKNQNIKSIINISSDVSEIGLHNARLNAGKSLISDLSDMERIPFNHFGSILTKDYFLKNQHRLDNAFIYHCIFKSQVEYVSSLLRGNKQDVFTAEFKLNRWGFLQSKADTAEKITFDIPTNLLQDYYAKYNIFISDLELIIDIMLGQFFIINRYNKVKKLVQKDEETKKSYNFLFENIKLNYFNTLQTFYSVDSIMYLDDGSIDIVGWVVSKNDNFKLEFWYEVGEDLKPVFGELFLIEREDVLHQFPNIAKNRYSGFRFNFRFDHKIVQIKLFNMLNTRYLQRLGEVYFKIITEN